MSKTRMMYSAGVPLLGGGVDPIPFKQASREIPAVFFVDPLNGSDGNPGDNIDQPLLSWGKAHTLAPSTGGFTVYGWPTADSLEDVVITKKNATFINAARGADRCTIKSAAGIALTVQATGFQAYGMQFRSAAAVKAGAILQQDRSKFIDCDFISDLSIGCRLLPDTATAGSTSSEHQFLGCWFRECGGNGFTFENPAPVAGIGGEGPTGVLLKDCEFWANTSEDIKDVGAGGTTSGAAFFDCIVEHSKFRDRNKAVYITLNTGANNRGLLSNLDFACDLVGRLTNVMVAVSTAIVCEQFYDATGLVNTQGF